MSRTKNDKLKYKARNCESFRELTSLEWIKWSALSDYPRRKLLQHKAQKSLRFKQKNEIRKYNEIETAKPRNVDYDVN
jgi:hypothetical protein